MNIFRNLLFWIVLALAGALVAQVLLQDPGYVLVRYGGNDYITNVPKAALALLLVVIGLWLLWKLINLPFVAMRRHRKRQARAQLIDGLTALDQGQWSRAEKLLDQAAAQDQVRALAHAGAARAAAARGDDASMQRHLDALDSSHATTRALASAELSLERGRAAEALAALDAVA